MSVMVMEKRPRHERDRCSVGSDNRVYRHGLGAEGMPDSQLDCPNRFVVGCRHLNATRTAEIYAAPHVQAVL
jgi:hypothetical protein